MDFIIAGDDPMGTSQNFKLILKPSGAIPGGFSLCRITCHSCGRFANTAPPGARRGADPPGLAWYQIAA